MKQGMAAMITVIVLGALMVMVGSVMVLTSISEGQAALMETKVKKNQGLIDACTEESMLKINVNGAVPTLIITPNGRCNVTVNSQVGDSWDLNIGASGEMSPLQVNVVFGRGTTMLVYTWLDE
jgi:hypothetical protein